jgi:hypothetical protein
MNVKKLILFATALLGALFIVEYHVGRLSCGPDQLFQYAEAQAWLNGHGLTFPSALSPEVKAITFQPWRAFPPGFAVYSIPFISIFKDLRYYNAAIALVNVTLFIYLYITLFQKLSNRKIPPLRLIVFALAFFGLTGHVTVSAASSDMMCLLLYLAISWILLMPNLRPEYKVVSVSILALLTATFRYAYIPIVTVLPIVIFYEHVIVRKSKKRSYAVIAATFALALASGFLFYEIAGLGQKLEDIADPVLVEDGQSGLSNLRYASPFPFGAFFDIHAIIRSLGYESRFGYDRGYQYPYVIQLLFYIASFPILVLTWLFFKHLWQHCSVTNKRIYIVWILYSSASAVLLIGLLYYMSYSSISRRAEYLWNWSMIQRYYLMPTLVFYLALMYWAFQTTFDWKKGLSIAFLVLSMAFGFLQTSRNYIVNYVPFDFAHNTKLMRENESMYNSYTMCRNVISQDLESSGMLFIAPEIKDQVFFPQHFAALCNTVVPDTFYMQGLRMEADYPRFLLQAKDSTGEARLSLLGAVGRLDQLATWDNLSLFMINESTND